MKTDNKKLLMKYGAIASGIAAVAIEPSSAQMIYTDLNPDSVLTAGEVLLIDFDANGIDELEFVLSSSNYSARVKTIGATSTLRSRFSYFGPDYGYSKALFQGDSIVEGPFPTSNIDYLRFETNNSVLNSNYGGDFRRIGTHYLGVRFEISGETHYGWVALEFPEQPGNELHLHVQAYAYNATPDKKIITGPTVPVVAITGAPSIVNNQTPFTVTIESCENTNDLALEDMTVGNGNADNFVKIDDHTYTVEITADGNGDVTLDIDAATFTSSAFGTDNLAANQVTITYSPVTNLSESDLNSQVSISPNPTSGALNVGGLNVKSLELMDLAGNALVTSTSNKMDISELSTGVYLLRIHSESQVITKRIVKE